MSWLPRSFDRRIARGLAGLALLAIGLVAGEGTALARNKRLRPPPDVTLHPDRGMTFTRFPRTARDPRTFKSLNQATRLPVMDPAIDPYNLGAKSSVYDARSGQIRGSLTDQLRNVRRGEQGAGRLARSAGETPTTSKAQRPRSEAWPSPRPRQTEKTPD